MFIDLRNYNFRNISGNVINSTISNMNFDNAFEFIYCKFEMYLSNKLSFKLGNCANILIENG